MPRIPRKHPRNFIRQRGSEWREIPDALITDALCDLPIVGATNEMFADYVARRLGLSGEVEVEFRDELPDHSMKIVEMVSVTVPGHVPGTPIFTLPGGRIEMIAHFVAPKEENPAQ